MNQEPTIDVTEARRRLVAGERQLVEEIEALDGRAGEMQTPGEVVFSTEGTLADEAALAVDREKELALRRALQARLLDTRHALQQLDRGTYGQCEACGMPIPPRRLKAVPHATLCLRCKAQTERGSG